MYAWGVNSTDSRDAAITGTTCTKVNAVDDGATDTRVVDGMVGTGLNCRDGVGIKINCTSVECNSLNGTAEWHLGALALISVLEGLWEPLSAEIRWLESLWQVEKPCWVSQFLLPEKWKSWWPWKMVPGKGSDAFFLCRTSGGFPPWESQEGKKEHLFSPVTVQIQSWRHGFLQEVLRNVSEDFCVLLVKELQVLHLFLTCP